MLEQFAGVSGEIAPPAWVKKWSRAMAKKQIEFARAVVTRAGLR